MSHQNHHHEQHGHRHAGGKGNKAIAITLAVLIVTALVLGLLLYKKGGKRDVPYGSMPQAVGSIPNRQGAPAGAATGDVMSVPGPNATEAERQAHAQLVFSTAVETQSIDLSSCRANPLVSKVRQGSQVTLANGDGVPHTMVFSPELTFVVPAKSSLKVEADFGYGPGIYGFGCDQSPVAAGLILLTE